MKPKLFTAILLFISGYSPLFAILLVKDFDFKISHNFKHPYIDYSIISLIVLSIILLFYSINSIEKGEIVGKITSIKNRSTDIINYTIPYMLSFFGVDLSKPEDLIGISIFILILLLLTITSNSIFINPVLAMAHYGLYDIEYEFDGKKFSTVLLTKNDVHVGDRCYLRSLTRFLYFTNEKSTTNGSQ